MHYLSSVAFMKLNDRVGFRSRVIPEVPPRVNIDHDLTGDGSAPKFPSACRIRAAYAGLLT